MNESCRRCCSGSLPHRQLRNIKNRPQVGRFRSLPHRQLRKQKNTQFTVIYNFGTQLGQTKSAISPDSNQKLSFTIGTGAAIQPNSVELAIPVNHSVKNAPGTVVLTDVPINSSTGNLVTRTGDIQGTINYTSGAVEVTPILIKKEFIQIYTPTTVYGSA